MSELHTRKEKRTPVTLKIKFKSATLDQFIGRYSVDVSQGGIFIRTKDPLGVGTQLRFEFQLQDASPLISGDGTVVWTREFDPSRTGVAPGMGVRFDRLAPESQPILEQILSRKAGSSKPPPGSDSFDVAHDPSRQTGEKTKITPPNLASSLAAAARLPSHVPGAQPDKAARGGPGTLAPPRGGFAEESSRDHTPLPKPMPFTGPGDDEFSEEIFEQPTKVASIESLIRHEEEQARAAQAEAAAAAAAQIRAQLQRDVDDEEQTGVRSRPRAKPDIHVVPPAVPAPPPPAAAAPPPPPPRRALSEPGRSTPPVADALPPRPADPVFLQQRSAPAVALPRPEPTPPPPPATAKGSAVPYVAGGTVVLLAAAAAVYLFVIRPGDEPPPRPAPTASKPAPVAAEPAVGRPAPAPTPPAPKPPAPAPAPAVVAKKIDVKLTSKPSGAQVTIDGAEHGATPTTLAGLDTTQTYTVGLASACYKTESVALAPKEDSPVVHVALKPLERVVHVKSDPPGALLSIDGRPAGKTPTDIRLVGKLDAKTAHVFLLHKAGFEAAQTTVSPDSPCATESDVGALGLSVSLTPLRRVVETPPPAPARVPAKATAPRPEEPAAAPRPAPRPEPAEVAKPPPKPEPEPAKVEAPKPEPKKPEPKKAEPAAAPSAGDRKDCDPSPDAPEWAKCK